MMLRSLAFNILFYANFLAFGVALLPLLLAPPRMLLGAVRLWARVNLVLLRAVVGLKVEIRGREHIPAGPLLVASKHQSALETFALIPLFADPTFVLKRELMRVPFFGWYAARTGMIPIERGAGSVTMRRMAEAARREAAAGRQIVIFPEGTRRYPGAAPAYKFGIAHLYAELGLPLLPIALDTGRFWPRRSFLRRPGTAVIEILDPIPPGLPRSEILGVLQDRIETATARLYAEPRGARPQPAIAAPRAVP
jgi:1-acyl-sn-glycerol-3-phosphate acyltransferase